MIRDTSVVWGRSELTDAPVLSGTAGSLIALLDAFLINGWCIRSFDSVTVADGVATLVMSGGCPYEKHAVVEIRGHSETTLNRRWRVDTVSADRLTFTVDSEVPAGTYSAGSATVRFAPAGWGKPLQDAGNQVAVYQSAALDSTQLYLHVRDNEPMYTRVRGYETAPTLETLSGAFPTFTQAADGVITWRKSSTANGVARRWFCWSDGKFVWVMPAWHATYPAIRTPSNFGDLIPVDENDAYHCILTAHAAAAPGTPGVNHICTGIGDNTYSRVVARLAAQTGTATPVGNNLSGAWARGTGQGPTGDAQPHYVGGQVLMQDGVMPTSPLRGVLPGVRITFQSSAFSDLQMIEQGGEAFMAVTVASASAGQAPAVFCLTGA